MANAKPASATTKADVSTTAVKLTPPQETTNAPNKGVVKSEVLAFSIQRETY
jgi:hypothetical protein